MRRKRLETILCGGFAALTLLAAATPPGRTVPYANLYRIFERVARLQGGKYVRAQGVLRSLAPEVPTDQIRMVVRSERGEMPVSISPGGHADFPLTSELLAENPPVFINVPEGKLTLSVDLRVEAEPRARFRYALGNEMREDVRSAVARQGMIARMMLPDFEDFVISFAPGQPAWATVELVSGPHRLEADAEGNIHLPDRRDWRRENPFIQLSGEPLRLWLRAR
jgi:hypothetical protein